jgi:hypothetical protein
LGGDVGETLEMKNASETRRLRGGIVTAIHAVPPLVSRASDRDVPLGVLLGWTRNE